LVGGVAAHAHRDRKALSTQILKYSAPSLAVLLKKKSFLCRLPR